MNQLSGLCPGGFDTCSMWDYKHGYKCSYALCKYWDGLRAPPSLEMKPWADSKVTPEKPAANKCPTCRRAYRKKKKAAASGPTPLEAYIEEQKKKESGRPFDDELPW